MDEQQKKMAEELLFSDNKKPSFAKLIYFGIFNSSHIFPYPNLSTEEAKETNAYLEKVKTLVADKIDAAAIDRNACIPDSLIADLANLGVLGMTIPKQYGGLGLTQYAYCKAVETIAHKCGSTALFVNAHQSIGLKALLLFGTEEQRKKWLPSLAKGESIAAFSLTEPNAGSDASGVETRAVYVPEKKVFRINGKKQWTTNGSIAKVLTVMAQTSIKTPLGMQDKITAFLVTPDMPGFHVINPALEKVGMRGTKTANLEFKDLEVPEENILGPLGGGLKVCLTVLDYGRTTFGAACTGAGKFLVEQAIAHAASRYQFKRPLASFSLVKKKIATMSAYIYAMEAMTYMTAGLVDSNVEDIMLESAMLKVFASDSLWNILYDTMQIYGGRSFFTDYPFERMMRDARLNMIGEGSNEVMRAFIGVVGMRDVGMQLQGVLNSFKHPLEDFDGILNFTKQRWHSLFSPKIPVTSPQLEKEGRRLGKAIRSFGFNVTKVLTKYKQDVLEKQLTLDRIANAAMHIYAVTCVLSKLDSELAASSKKESELAKDVACGKLFCRLAFDIIEDNVHSLFNGLDSEIEEVSDLISGVTYP